MVRLSASLACLAATFEGAQAELEGCANFAELGFDLYKLDKYDTFFTDESVLVLALTGAYTGTEDIKEYMLFATPSGAFLDEVVINAPANVNKKVDDPYDCIFVGFYTGVYTWAKERSGGEINTSPQMSKIYYNSVAKKVTRINYEAPPGFFNQAFHSWDTPATHKFICGIMKDRCSDVWKGSGFASIQECVDDLATMPLVNKDEPLTLTIQGGADDYNRACRMIHAGLAEENVKHCPHISPTPIADDLGRIKCQPGSSLNLTHRDLFDEWDDAEWLKYAKENGFDSLDPGFKIVQEVGGAGWTCMSSLTAVALSSVLLLASYA